MKVDNQSAKTVKNAENPQNSHTGSAKTDNLKENSAKNDNFAENPVKNEEIQAPKPKNADFPENPCQNAENTAFQSSNNVKSNENSEIFGVKEAETVENPRNSSDLSVTSSESQELIQTDFDVSTFFSEKSIIAFKEEFPLVDVDSLRNDAKFCDLLDVFKQKPTLSAVYKQFSKIVSAAEESSSKKLLQRLANASSSVGSLSVSAPSNDGFFTKEQVKQMTPEQIRKNYSTIRQSQAKW